MEEGPIQLGAPPPSPIRGRADVGFTPGIWKIVSTRSVPWSVSTPISPNTSPGETWPISCPSASTIRKRPLKSTSMCELLSPARPFRRPDRYCAHTGPTGTWPLPRPVLRNSSSLRIKVSSLKSSFVFTVNFPLHPESSVVLITVINDAAVSDERYRHALGAAAVGTHDRRPAVLR